jgi:hypothetical protein
MKSSSTSLLFKYGNKNINIYYQSRGAAVLVTTSTNLTNFPMLNELPLYKIITMGEQILSMRQ